MNTLDAEEPESNPIGRLLRGAGVYLISNIMYAAIPFALLPVLTRYLTPAEYGEVAMFKVCTAILMAFIGLSLHGSAVRKYYDKGITKSNLAAYIGSCLLILAITSIIGVLLCLLLSDYLPGWLGLRIEWVYMSILTAACTMVCLIRLGQWQAEQKAGRYGIFQVGKSVVEFLLSLVLVVVVLNGADGRIHAQVIAVGLFALIALLLLHRNGLVSVKHINKVDIKAALRFGVPLIPHTAGAFLLLSVDRFILNQQLGLKEVGIYMVAVELGTGISLLLDSINKAFMPWLFERLKRNKPSEIRQLVFLTYGWYILLIFGAGLAFLIGPWLVSLLASNEYVFAGQIFGWIALGQAFKGMYLMQTNYIFYSKKTGALATVTISCGLVNIVLMIYLIGLYGLMGAAYSFAISMFIFFVLTWVVAQHKVPMPWLTALVQSKGTVE